MSRFAATATIGWDRLDVPWVRDFFSPVEVEVAVGTATPLLDGNVAVFEDRWKLITLPTSVELVTDDPARVTQILSTPVANRVDEWRIVHRIDDIAMNWEPYVDVDVHRPPTGTVPTPTSTVPDG